MIPYELDPSLHVAEPAPPLLGDGFSPPAAHGESEAPVLPSGEDAPDLRPRPSGSHQERLHRGHASSRT